MRTLVCSIALIIFSNFGFAQKAESKRIMDQSFKNIQDYTLEFLGTYTDFILEDWDKDEISIHIEIITKARNKEKADKLLDKINMKIKNQNKTISIHTSFTHQKFFKFKSKEKFEIKCIVKAPAHIKYYLSNTSGNIFISKITGKTTIRTKYGNFKAKELNFSNSSFFELNDLNFAYSNIQIDYCNTAKITSSYSNLNITKAKALKINSKYSDIDIDAIESLHINTRYSDCNIKTVKIIDVKSATYTNIKIGHIDSKLKSEQRYGNIDIDDVSPTFRTIDINAAYGDVNIKFSPNTTYKLNADSEYGSIKLPKKANIDRHLNSNDNDDEHVKGIVGPNNITPTGNVNITTRYGDIDLVR